MTEASPACPACGAEYSYQDQHLWVCSMCAHEWSLDAVTSAPSADVAEAPGFVDVHGNPLQDGDAVTVVRDLKVGGSTIKSGTKVKGIRLLDEPVNGHDIACKVDGHGALYLKCSVVKKA